MLRNRVKGWLKIVLTSPFVFLVCQAERDGDNIWATINTTSNQDGHTVTPLIAPSGQQQQQLLCDMYSSLGDDVDNIDYIEAHGEEATSVYINIY